MDLLNMGKLMEGVALVQKISDNVTDDQSYNVTNQTVNQEVLMEGTKTVEKILENGKKMKDEVDLSQLESDVNEALGITEGTDEKLDKVGEEDSDVNNDGKVDDQDKYIKNKRKTITKSINENQGDSEMNTKIKTPKAKVEAEETKAETQVEKVTPEISLTEAEAKVKEAKAQLEAAEKELQAQTEASKPHVATPAVGVDTAEKFQKAVAVEQSDFVNSNTEHSVSPTGDKEEVDKEADSVMKDKRKFVDKVQNDNLKEKQNEVDATKPEAVVPASKMENAEKFIGFLESIKDDENSAIIEASTKAFKAIYMK